MSNTKVISVRIPMNDYLDILEDSINKGISVNDWLLLKIYRSTPGLQGSNNKKPIPKKSTKQPPQKKTTSSRLKTAKKKMKEINVSKEDFKPKIIPLEYPFKGWSKVGYADRYYHSIVSKVSEDEFKNRPKLGEYSISEKGDKLIYRKTKSSYYLYTKNG